MVSEGRNCRAEAVYPSRQFCDSKNDRTDLRRKRLGEILRERGQISGHNLLSAVHEQTGKSVLLGELLLERNMVSKNDLVAALEEVTRVRYVDLRSAAIDSEALKLIPRFRGAILRPPSSGRSQ